MSWICNQCGEDFKDDAMSCKACGGTEFHKDNELPSYAALAASHEKLVEALKAAQEELRLIRMKDSNAVYDPILRTATIPLALAEAEKLTKET